MRRKLVKITIISLITIIGLFLGIAGTINIARAVQQPEDTYEYLTGDAKKVILFIGDGMGENHISNTELYLDKKLFFTSFDKNGYMTTYSKNTYWPTDSAAAATAMATGNKVYNTSVAYEMGENITSISEIAKENGLGVGIITTDTLAGATPSAFSGHSSDRSDDIQIIESQLENNIDLYLGAGRERYSEYKNEWENKGYSFVDNYEQLLTKNYSGKIIGSFDEVSYSTKDDKVTLSILTTYAIEYFERNYPDGYFLMIEGAHIDKMNHQNNILDMMNFMVDFDNSIKIAYDKFHDNKDVCLIVTADHESGGLQLASTKEELTDELYTTDGHTHDDVRYFIYQKDNSDIYKISDIIDNTNIFLINTKLLNLKYEDKEKTL